MNTTVTHYTEPGLNAPLSNREKYELSALAKKAWQKMARAHATDESEKDFRQRMSIQSCGRRISEALRGDYNKIEAALAIIAGETGRALQAGYRDQTSGARIAMNKLTVLLKEQGRDISYAARICRSMNKVELEDATSSQIWKVYYSLAGTPEQRAARLVAYKARSPRKAKAGSRHTIPTTTPEALALTTAGDSRNPF